MRAPWIFYGTAWKEERTEALTRAALAAGFRAIDTANQRRHYVEAAVGAAIADSGVPRAELFLQTKYTYPRGQDHRLPYDPAAPFAEQVAQSVASSLEHLRTDHLDAYLLHGPADGRGIERADREVWAAMIEQRRLGTVRAIGVSNVSLAQLRALCDEGDEPPAFVQNRCYASTGWDREVRALCRERGIAYQGFSLLTANRRELAGPALAKISARVGRPVAAVVFRFAAAVGMIPLTGTASSEHMREDLDAATIDLDDRDLTTIESIGAA